MSLGLENQNAISKPAAQTKASTQRLAVILAFYWRLILKLEHPGKANELLANADSAGLGARIPIVPTNRADSVRSKTASYAVKTGSSRAGTPSEIGGELRLRKI